MTANLPIVSRHCFIHVFSCGRVLRLHVAKTKTHIKFQFIWNPTLKTLEEFGEIQREFMEWESHWLGGELSARHAIQDFQFHQSCQAEIYNLISQLTP